MGELELFRTPLEVCVAFAGSSLQPPTPSNPSSNLKAAQGEEAGLNHSAKGQPQPPAQYPDLTSRTGGGGGLGHQGGLWRNGGGGLGGCTWQATLKMRYKVLKGTHAPGQKH